MNARIFSRFFRIQLRLAEVINASSLKSTKRLIATATCAKFQSEMNSEKTQSKTNKLELTEEEWMKKLTPEQYNVCRQKGTEAPFSGKYNKHDKEGIYMCVGCGTELFSSDAKYDPGCGWPSFHTAYGATDGDESQANVVRQPDNSLGRKRVEVLCKQCNSHLGHVFPDGPQPTGERFCINSVCLNFKQKKT